MATATATPELFTNLISTFIADSDMGLGAIIGSLMWNILGVAAVSSLATRKVYKLVMQVCTETLLETYRISCSQ